MITIQHIEENLSRAYITAVSARAGFNTQLNRSHDYKVDGTVHEVSSIRGSLCETGLSIDFQAKASVQWEEKDSKIIYDLDADTYNFLCHRATIKSSTPIILIFLALPRDPESWLFIDEEQLILKKACYWKILSGDYTTNKETIRVFFSTEQKFDPHNLQNLFKKFRETGGLL